MSYTYDPVYPRVATMVDGIGTTSDGYKAPGVLGAGQVASVDGPLTNDTITYTYDELGRVTVRAINGSANTVTWGFDALGRVASEQNLLGTFTCTYDGVTPRQARSPIRTARPAPTATCPTITTAGCRRFTTSTRTPRRCRSSTTPTTRWASILTWRVLTARTSSPAPTWHQHGWTMLYPICLATVAILAS